MLPRAFANSPEKDSDQFELIHPRFIDAQSQSRLSVFEDQCSPSLHSSSSSSSSSLEVLRMKYTAPSFQLLYATTERRRSGLEFQSEALKKIEDRSYQEQPQHKLSSPKQQPQASESWKKTIDEIMKQSMTKAKKKQQQTQNISLNILQAPATTIMHCDTAPLSHRLPITCKQEDTHLASAIARSISFETTAKGMPPVAMNQPSSLEPYFGGLQSHFLKGGKKTTTAKNKNALKNGFSLLAYSEEKQQQQLGKFDLKRPPNSKGTTKTDPYTATLQKAVSPPKSARCYDSLAKFPSHTLGELNGISSVFFKTACDSEELTTRRSLKSPCVSTIVNEMSALLSSAKTRSSIEAVEQHLSQLNGIHSRLRKIPTAATSNSHVISESPMYELTKSLSQQDKMRKNHCDFCNHKQQRTEHKLADIRWQLRGVKTEMASVVQRASFMQQELSESIKMIVREATFELRNKMQQTSNKLTSCLADLAQSTLQLVNAKKLIKEQESQIQNITAHLLKITSSSHPPAIIPVASAAFSAAVTPALEATSNQSSFRLPVKNCKKIKPTSLCLDADFIANLAFNECSSNHLIQRSPKTPGRIAYGVNGFTGVGVNPVRLDIAEEERVSKPLSSKLQQSSPISRPISLCIPPYYFATSTHLKKVTHQKSKTAELQQLGIKLSTPLNTTSRRGNSFGFQFAATTAPHQIHESKQYNIDDFPINSDSILTGSEAYHSPTSRENEKLEVGRRAKSFPNKLLQPANAKIN